MTFCSPRLVAIAVLLAPAALAAAELPIIARARARLGSDQALDGVRTLHFYATLSTTDPRDPSKQVSAKLELLFEKPDRQRISATYDRPARSDKPDEHPFVETTALDAYEAWTRVQDFVDASKWRMTLLDAERVKQLRASTWESLHFFRGIEDIGGRVEDLGSVTKDGVACRKVAFVHAPKIVFYRYFETATGRLVVTETNTGMSIRESGEMVVGGIRFPKTSVTTQETGGKISTVTVTYDRVMLNEVFPHALFAVPALRTP